MSVQDECCGAQRQLDKACDREYLEDKMQLCKEENKCII